MSSAPVTPSSEDAPAGAVTKKQSKLLKVTIGVALGVLILDQISKWYVVHYWEYRLPIELIGPVLRLNVVRNPGAAFSLGAGFTIVFSLIALVVGIVIVRSARTLGSLGWAIALGGLLGGATGNLLDRIFRAPGFLRGHVVDFLEFPNWPVWNVADASIVISAIIMVILSLRGIGLKGLRDD